MFGTSSNRWHLFTLFGHRVSMEPWFLLLIAFFAFAGVTARNGGLMFLLENLLVWGPTLFIGVLFHEFGHAFALKRLGYGTSKIILQGFGGVTINDQRQGSPPGKSILISLAGPAASLVLAGLSFGGYLLLVDPSNVTVQSMFGGSQGLFARLLAVMAGINVVWAIFNLMPINPLDGGHVVLHSLRAKFSYRKALRYSAGSSLVFLGLLTIFGLQFFEPLLFLILAFMFGMQNWRIWRATQGEGDRGPNMRH